MKRLAIALSLVASVARADDPPTPWSQGVSAERQAAAKALIAEANQLFAEQAHAAALAKYSAALAQWDHPTIRFNMAVTLVRLDRFLEAAEAIDAALHWGREAFTPEKYQQALDYKTLVDRQLGTIEVSCTQPGARVRLDGKSWFSCPGTNKRRLVAGEHMVVGEADGYMTLSRPVNVTGRGAFHVDVALVTLESAVKLEYPTPAAIPWTVAIAGGVIGLAGVPVWYTALQQRDRFLQQYERECAARCEEDLAQHPALREQYESARLTGNVAVAMWITGGTLATAGVVWALVFNRPRRVLPNVELVPTANGATARAQWRF